MCVCVCECRFLHLLSSPSKALLLLLSFAHSLPALAIAAFLFWSVLVRPSYFAWAADKKRRQRTHDVNVKRLHVALADANRMARLVQALHSDSMLAEALCYRDMLEAKRLIARQFLAASSVTDMDAASEGFATSVAIISEEEAQLAAPQLSAECYTKGRACRMNYISGDTHLRVALSSDTRALLKKR